MSYTCLIMNAIFNHIESENTNGKAFTYLKCDHRCKFTSHINHHTGESSFNCTECDYRRNCTSHIEHHTGEKPLRWSLCEYRCKHFRFIRFVNRFSPTIVLIYIRPFNFVTPIDAIFDCCYWLAIYVVHLFTKIFTLFPHGR